MSEVETALNAQIPSHTVHDDSLLICLVEVTRLLGYPCSAEHLVNGLPIKNNLLGPELLGRAAARAQCATKLLRSRLETIPNEALPAILFLKNGRHCVLVSRDQRNSMAMVMFAESPSPVEIEMATLLEIYDGLAAFIKPHYRVEQRSQESLPIAQEKNWFWSTVWDNWRLYRDALAAALLINLFAMVMPLFTLNVYDRVVPNNAFDTLWALAAGVVIVLLFNWLLTVTRSRVVDKASSEVDIRISAKVMERVLDLRLASRPTSVGAFAANLRSFEAVRDFIASASLTTLVDVPFSLLFVAVLGWISPYLMVPPLVAMVVILILSFFSQRRIRAFSADLFQAGAQRNAVLVESLAGLETIKVLNAQSRSQQQWEQATEQIARVNLKIRYITSSTVNFIQTVQQLTTVAVVMVGVYLIADSQLSLGGIIASSMLAGRSLAPLGSVAGLMMQYYHTRQSLGAIDTYMQLPIEHDVQTNFLPRPHIKGDIQFKNLSFAYPNTNFYVLEKLNLHIKQGERVGIIGRIGSGKSTLAKLILGLYQPIEGALLVDGVDSQQIDAADLRRAMGYVSQDPVLFYGTLKQNLLMGAPFATDEQMLEVAKLTGVDRFASKHPQGYDMIISERGESLSGGQRQAIAVARALLNNPSVLLLDEPSSNMDNQSELNLRKHLKPVCEGRTVLLITHRMALLELVDRLIVIDNGKIMADGPKDQVITALREGRISKQGA
ncbi:type I secretion system permease/ATPase [Paenalcaligenes hominis]|uniref:type I secretion system permease/ATPase n=1 Tax=Paenalcaligenes hominis TaxID=643674 RepID=UPI0035256951